MSTENFRRIALGMKDATEGEHMKHPDFRIHGRLFASLHQDHVWGMVALTPEQQAKFVEENPVAFAPETGAWGRAGYTKVRLDSIAEDALGEAMSLAWQNTAAKGPAVSRKKPKPRQ